MSNSTSVMPAPGELEFVRQFVNTFDIDAGTDLLSQPRVYQEWAAEFGIDGLATDTDLIFARELREALRAALIANHDGASLPLRTIDALDGAVDRSQLTVRFTPNGVKLVSDAVGLGAVYGRLVAAVTSAIAEKSWQRLKACVADDCQWGFYDTSRSRTGQWCSMSICGNRAKQARWRTIARFEN